MGNTIPKVAAIIPFYSGDGGFYAEGRAFSPALKRQLYLRTTLDSLPDFIHKIVCVCSSDDKEKVFAMRGVDLICFVKCDPKHLVTESCKICQVDGVLGGYDYVLYTDADHRFVVRNWDKLLDFVQGDNYVVPHRIEECCGIYGCERGPRISFMDRDFVIVNHAFADKEDFFQVNNLIQGYGGAYLCTHRLFDKIQFRTTASLPGEQGAGFNIFETGNCFKTANYYDFMVEHLSGYDYHKSLRDKNER